MRRQPIKVQTGRRKRIAIFLSSIAIVALIIVTVLIKVVPEMSSRGKFKAPPFDVNAVSGEPKPDEKFGNSPVQAAGTFKFKFDSVLYQQKDSSLYVHFTNPEDSEMWMMAEVSDTEGKILYQTGIVKNGKYVEKLKPLIEMPNKATKVTIKVYGYEPETYYSKGIVQLNTVLQAK